MYDSVVPVSRSQSTPGGIRQPEVPRDRKSGAQAAAWLDAATSLADLGAIRGNRLEALKGDRTGQHSIRINDRWRICFSWREGNAYDVEIVDYH